MPTCLFLYICENAGVYLNLVRMEFIDLVVEEQVAHVRLNRGRSNAIHGPMIAELNEVIGQVQADPAIRGLILHGKEGFFSSGLDLMELYDLDEEGVRRFWTQFIALIAKFVAFDKPSVAAISGHSPAGGCVLAICCDYRVMAEGDFVIGLNELPVGIVVPEAVFQLYGFWIGQAAAYRNLLEGKLFTPSEALATGLVDHLVPQDRLMTAADQQMRKYLQFEPQSWTRSKSNLRRALIHQLKSDHTDDIEAILAQWWAPSTRNILKTIIDNLKAKKS